MDSIKFLIKKLESLHQTCPYLEIKYEYRDYLNTHIIDVRPPERFENDSQYISSQLEIEKEFENLFSSEDILFITENELIDVNLPILELGPSQKECLYDLVAPVKIEYSYEKITEYCIDTNVQNQFQIPESPPPKPWWKNPLKSKQALKENQGFFV